MNDEEIRKRVPQLAGEALAKGFVSSVDVLLALGWLSAEDLRAWREGRIPYLERVVHQNLGKVSTAMRAFHAWAQHSKLKPSLTVYHHRSHPLRFSKSGDGSIERRYSTHYLRPVAAPRQEPPRGGSFEFVVHHCRGQQPCRECQRTLAKDEFICVEEGTPVCLECADLDHLVFVPAGDAALTRRSTKYSRLSAVVVKWSRARKRFERQGILVEEAALKRARIECAMDAEDRAARREQDAGRRERQDEQLEAAMQQAIRQGWPGCSATDARAIAAHTAVRGSGRVGRTAAGRALDERALKLAVYAHIRHVHSNYDELLMKGVPRREARASVEAHVQEVFARWRQGRGAESGDGPAP
ncbi:MAG: DUF2293 domain-containing protein [Deltaproteobacteria bacterium]|nr:DUF2293 domain-containing protein [Deltaproteobacteria bacterium]